MQGQEHCSFTRDVHFEITIFSSLATNASEPPSWTQCSMIFFFWMTLLLKSFSNLLMVFRALAHVMAKIGFLHETTFPITYSLSFMKSITKSYSFITKTYTIIILSIIWIVRVLRQWKCFFPFLVTENTANLQKSKYHDSWNFSL